ncbi:MAG: hypothetical protein AAGI03_08025 [Pseudomonadota bacterium]
MGTRSGVFATFASDPEAALRNAIAEQTRPIGAYDLKPDERPSMITYTIGPAEQATDASIYERPLTDRIPGPHELDAATDVQIAIRWSCDCDFDLAVQPVGGQAISYRQQHTAAGTLHKDFTSSAALELGWETVSLPGPLKLADAVVGINLFRGLPGAVVELRIAIGTETWGQSYTIPGPADGGGGFVDTVETRQPANPAWVIVDPGTMFGGV